MTPILRYQDREGRGPFRPGMAARWSVPGARRGRVIVA